MHIGFKAGAALLALATWTVGAQATEITGTINLSAPSVSHNTSSTLTATIFTPTSQTLSTGTGDYGGVPDGTVASDGTLNLGNLGAFTWTSSEGTWTTTDPSASLYFRSGSASFGAISVFLYGTFTPSGSADAPLNTESATPSLEQLNISHTGAAWDWSATVSSPSVAPSVPEPISLVLLGTALAGLGIARRRK